MENIYDILKSRNLIKQVTFEEEFKKLVENEKVSIYMGIDPTADSIHIGHFIPLMLLSYFQKCGHTPIILIGGGTALIGDPSGKTDMRKMITKEIIDSNVLKIIEQVKKFVSFEGENKAILVNNADWILDLNYMNFISTFGIHFNVNRMLAAECFKQRMENGLTFFELNYMLMQSYDFLQLFENYNCKIQLGGDDQWSNMLAGVDVIRKIHKSGSFCLTCPLLLNKDGIKMGKTVNGALWLSKEKTNVFDFYQYWRNISDEEVYDVLRMLTFLPMSKVNELSNLQGKDINEAKKIAAFEITKLIHSEEEAIICKKTSEDIFENNICDENMPTININENSINILDLLIECDLIKSKSQGRILIDQSGISIDDNIINDINYTVDSNCILKKGKKIFYKINILK